jgi:CelD/BcsL family acetyltransferase involved in cellulose biosynthesis
VGDVSWQVVGEPEPDSDVLEAWDGLAVARGRPYCAPGWMLSWGASARRRPHLRIGVVREGQRVIGVIPLAGRALPPGGGATYELLGSGIGYRIEPLAAPGKQELVAGAIAELLGSLRPVLGVLCLDGIDPESGWSGALAAAYPNGRGASVIRRTTLHAPILEIGDADSYEDWLRSKGRHFRKRAAGDRRKLLRSGRLELASTPAELTQAIRAFAALHLGRWRGRRRSNLDFPSMQDRLLAAAQELGPERIRASIARVGEEIVSVDVFVHAGGVAASWNGGWLDSHRDLRPGWLTLLGGIEDAIERGAAEVDLGPGAHPWKRRLATRHATVVADRLLPRGPRSLATHLYLLPERIRETARRRPGPGAPAESG